MLLRWGVARASRAGFFSLSSSQRGSEQNKPILHNGGKSFGVQLREASCWMFSKQDKILGQTRSPLGRATRTWLVESRLCWLDHLKSGRRTQKSRWQARVRARCISWDNKPLQARLAFNS